MQIVVVCLKKTRVIKAITYKRQQICVTSKINVKNKMKRLRGSHFLNEARFFFFFLYSSDVFFKKVGLLSISFCV